MKGYSYFTKRLGQRHICRVDRTDGRTLCGKPMLGNDYTIDYEKYDPPSFKDCKTCFDIYHQEQADGKESK